MKLKALLLSLILVVSMPTNAFFTTGLINAVTDFFTRTSTSILPAFFRILISNNDNDSIGETFEEWQAKRIKEARKKEVAKESVDGKKSKVTFYYKTGEIEEVYEYVDGKLSKSIHYYYQDGKVKEVDEYVDGKKSKVTFYYKTGEVEQVVEFVNGKFSKNTFYHKNGEVKNIELQ